MDILSHALWGGTIIKKKSLVGWAMLTGAMPDILGSGPATLYLLLTHGWLWSTDTWPLLTEFLKSNYHFWHSLLAAAVVFLAIIFINRRMTVLIIPYLLHIGMDFFTHETDIPFRLFFPFIDYDAGRVIGLNWWEDWRIWGANATLLLGINAFFWLRKISTKDRTAT